MISNPLLRIHSIETFGTHEGPGIRFVIFVQGCNYRCLYCHNPDTQAQAKSEKLKVKSDNELIEMIERCQPYFGTKGGVTISGGEPLLQAKALTVLFKKLKNCSPFSPPKLGGVGGGINTALDTNGSILNNDIKELLKYTDLVLLDIKHFDSEWHEKITGNPLSSPPARGGVGGGGRNAECIAAVRGDGILNQVQDDKNKIRVPSLTFLNYLKEINKPVWIRYVLVPGYTDQEESIEALSAKLKGYDNIERIEILPYHTLGVHKYKELCWEYKLEGIEPPTKEQIEKAEKIFKKSGKLIIVR